MALTTSIISRDVGSLLSEELRMVQVVMKRRAKDGVEGNDWGEKRKMLRREADGVEMGV